MHTKEILLSFCLICIHLRSIYGIKEINKKVLISCYKCDGEECLRSSSADQTAQCDSCVALFDGFTLSKRGCYSSLLASEKTICDATKDNSCYKCSFPLCNNLARIDHTCVQCDSNTNAKCLNKPTSLSATRCPLSTTSDQYCFVKWNRTSGENERGCLSSYTALAECTKTNDVCSMCSVNANAPCNTNELPEGRIKCITCDANADKCPKANSTADEIDQRSVYCKNATDWCVILNRGSGDVRQLCAANLATADNEFCENHCSSCKKCNTNNCNLAEPKEPSSSPSIRFNWMLLTLASITMALCVKDF